MKKDFDCSKPLNSTYKEKFCVSRAYEELSQYDSYCKAYPNQVKEDNKAHINRKASELAKRDDIKDRINFLRLKVQKGLAKKAIQNKEDILSQLEWCVKKAKDNEGFFVNAEGVKVGMTTKDVISEVRACSMAAARVLGLLNPDEGGGNTDFKTFLLGIKNK